MTRDRKKPTRFEIKTPQDILDRCYVDDRTGCWIWAGSLSGGAKDRGDGSPQAYYHKQRRHTTVLRILADMHGMTLAPKVIGWRQVCWEPLCCNFAHAKFGTTRQFIFARRKAGIEAPVLAGGRTGTTWKSSLTPSVKLQIMRSGGETAASLASRLGVSAWSVRRFRRSQSFAASANSSIFTLAASMR